MTKPQRSAVLNSSLLGLDGNRGRDGSSRVRQRRIGLPDDESCRFLAAGVQFFVHPGSRVPEAVVSRASAPGRGQNLGFWRSITTGSRRRTVRGFIFLMPEWSEAVYTAKLAPERAIRLAHHFRCTILSTNWGLIAIIERW